ncbi:hypothetical protein UPYG_G00186200 [Umbra pygmaea]|uniref:Uncharacterized protein n=1 Tax=Umbra pygmaea TaxID=75934 RepID=A0ABD0XEK1_UMBPY
MVSDDFCRFCKQNMIVAGVHRHSTNIFSKFGKPHSISDRLKHLGLTVEHKQSSSDRICQRCRAVILRLERDLPVYRSWVEDEKDGEAMGSTDADKILRKPTLSKTPDLKKFHLSSPGRPNTALRSITAVITHYPSHKKVVKVCDPEDALIIININKRKWKTAAKLIIKHKELVEEIKLNIRELIQEECKTLCNPNEGFMLWRSSAEDLKSFSFSGLQSDLDRIAPFLSSVFLTVTNNHLHATCAAAAIALRGRQPRMSAFAYYLNSILHYGGAKKAVFDRLSKMSITTSHTAAVGKQKEMANECQAGFCQLKHQNEIIRNMGAEMHTDNEMGAEMHTDNEMGAEMHTDYEGDVNLLEVHQGSPRLKKRRRNEQKGHSNILEHPLPLARMSHPPPPLHRTLLE